MVGRYRVSRSISNASCSLAATMKPMDSTQACIPPLQSLQNFPPGLLTPGTR